MPHVSCGSDSQMDGRLGGSAGERKGKTLVPHTHTNIHERAQSIALRPSFMSALIDLDECLDKGALDHTSVHKRKK